MQADNALPSKRLRLGVPAMTGPYADWNVLGACSGDVESPSEVPSRQLVDASDRGSVFVNWVSLEEDYWTATWERGENTVAWMSAHEGRRWIGHYRRWPLTTGSSAAEDEWVPLDAEPESMRTEGAICYPLRREFIDCVSGSLRCSSQ